MVGTAPSVARRAPWEYSLGNAGGVAGRKLDACKPPDLGLCQGGAGWGGRITKFPGQEAGWEGTGSCCKSSIHRHKRRQDNEEGKAGLFLEPAGRQCVEALPDLPKTQLWLGQSHQGRHPPRVRQAQALRTLANVCHRETRQGTWWIVADRWV